MRYRICRVREDGTSVPVQRAGTFGDVVVATDLCNELNELAHRIGSVFEYKVETVEVVPASRLW